MTTYHFLERGVDMKIVRAIVVLSLLLATSQVFASDWPQYLGPDRNVVSSEKGFRLSAGTPFPF